MTCLSRPRSSALLSSTRLTASNRLVLRDAWSPAISSWVIRTKKLIATLAKALLREDAGFHAYQMLEASVQQFHEWGNCDQGRHILIAVARHLAAHFPTQRSLLQTADIANRLMRGGELHREAAADISAGAANQGS